MTTIPPIDPIDPTAPIPEDGAGGNQGPTDLIFPKEVLSTIDHWIKFSSFEYSRANRAAGPEQGAFKSTIFLPMPAVISTEYTANYENESLGFLGTQARRAGAIAANEGLIQDFLSGRATSTQFSSVVDKAKEGVKNIPREATGSAVAIALDSFGSVGAGLSTGTGLARNPHLAVLYQGTDFRSHEFTFKLIPRDPQESGTIFSIVQAFKLAMAPSFLEGSENFLFEYPDEWNITFGHGEGMFDIGASVLKKFNVSYGSEEGGPKVFRGTKMPIEVNISLGFQETNIITKEDILESNR